MFHIEKQLQTEKVIWRLFQWILIILYSIVISSTILGVLSIYKHVYVFLFSTMISIILYKIWYNEKNSKAPQRLDLDIDQHEKINCKLLNASSYFTTALLVLLIFVPIFNWPKNTFEKSLNWDAGLYHLPKAVELWKTGSAWDFTISYGDYPFGYESLLSFNLILTNNESLFPLTHAIIALIFILSTWLLTMKYSRFPIGILLLAVVFLILSGFLHVPNPWYFLRYMPYTIGKNDLLLAAVTLSAILFVPLNQEKHGNIDWIGLGISSGLCISIKPNNVLIIIFLWIFALASNRNPKRYLKTILSGMALTVLGASWIVRNLLGFQHLFQKSSYRIVQWSIWSNINNPDFYLHIPRSLQFSFIFFLILCLVSLLRITRIRVGEVLLFLTILISFLITPASSTPGNPTSIAWRFGLVVLMIQFVYMINVIEPISSVILKWVIKNRWVTVLCSFLVILPMTAFFFWEVDFLRQVPEKANILKRPYTAENAPYLSVFDYIDENIDNSVVWVEGAQPYFAYDPEFTNTVTRAADPDYIIVVDKSIDDLWLDLNDWDLIYQDNRGSVYKNPSSHKGD